MEKVKKNWFSLTIVEQFLNGRYGEVISINLIFLAVLVVFFWPALFQKRALLGVDLIFQLDPLWHSLAPEGYSPSNPVLGDQPYQFFPWKVFLLQSLAQGQLPLWNPYTNCGLPFVGNAQSAVFSPFNLISYLFTLNAIFVVTAILRLWVAGLFTYLFAREIKLSRNGALLAGLTFAFSGPVIAWLHHPHTLVIVWLPAMLLATEKLLVQRSPKYLFLSGLFIGFQFLGGHPETSFHVLLAWGVYALYRTVSIEGWRPGRLWSHLQRLTLAAIIGILIGAVQTFPFLEAILNSATLAFRQEGARNSLSLTKLFFQWQQWPTGITVLVPSFFGAEAQKNYWYPYSNSVEQNAYSGILPLALAIVAVWQCIKQRTLPNRQVVLFFYWMAVMSLGIALNLPLFNVVNYLPIFSLVNNSRLRFVYGFAVAILAGLGFDYLINTRTIRTAFRILVIISLVNFLIVGTSFTGFIMVKNGFAHFGYAFTGKHWNTFFFNPLLYLPIFVTLIWGICQSVLFKRYNPPKWLGMVVLGVVLIDALLTEKSLLPFIDQQKVFPKPGAIQYLQQDPDIYRIIGTDLTLQPNTNMVFELADLRGYDLVVPRRFEAFIQQVNGYYAISAFTLFKRIDDNLLDLLNVKYALTDQNLGTPWELVYQDAGRVKVYRNPNVMPRAFIVYQAEIMDSADASLERLTDNAFDFRHSAILEQSPPDWTVSSNTSTPSGIAQIITYRPNHVIIQVETATEGLLILTDTYAPGWQAKIDSTAVPIYIADYTFRAVVVPAGTHHVEFLYQPLSFYGGAAASLLALTCMMGGLLFLHLKSRPKTKL